MMLKNKNAVIYGAGGTIGGTVAKAFAREGARVFLTGRNLASVSAIAEEIVAGGGTITASGTQHPFTMAVGGGLDFHINRNFSIRPVEVDYVLTRYTNPFTNTNNQNNFRYTAGVVFKF